MTLHFKILRQMKFLIICLKILETIMVILSKMPVELLLTSRHHWRMYDFQSQNGVRRKILFVDAVMLTVRGNKFWIES